MNQIQEMDWAEDCWHGHTGMDSSNDYCIVDEDKTKKDQAQQQTDNRDGDKK